MVVGAGIGGLACAIELAAKGCRVTVLERAPAAGGKARPRTVGGVELDAGPTVLTMPWVWEELFAAGGASFRERVGLERAEILARHAWPDGARLDLFADRQRSVEAIGEVFGPREARAYEAFCEDARRTYATVEGPFLRSQRPTVGGILMQAGALGLGALRAIDGMRTMARALEGRFGDPRLRQLFGRYATYCGSSPYDAPATLNLISHVEAEGVFRVKGGMRALAAALERLARELGVMMLFDADVDRLVVEGGRVTGVVALGERIRADAVVWNGDVSALAVSLAGREASRAVRGTSRDARSLSAVTWTMLARTAGFPLLHHNVFFSADYRREFDDILERRRVPEEPTIYVCAQDRGDDDAPLDRERLLVLVNAPATGDDATHWTESERARCETLTFRTLERFGLSITPEASMQTTPADFHRLYPATGGALYGPIASGAFSALTRQPAESKLRGLYLAGGSVHPGPGVPMAALSGRLAASRVREDLDSIARSRTVATSGTTSTA